MEKPGRSLRNLGEPWEPLRSWTGIGDGVGDVYGPARRERWEGGRLGWANLYRSRGDRLRTAAAAARRSRTTAKEGLKRTAAREPRDRPRNVAEKSGRVCRHNGLFVSIPTVGENRDGIRLAVDRLRTRTRWRG